MQICIFTKLYLTLPENQQTMKNKAGPPVEGDDFFGREKELAYAWRKLQSGNSLLLAAPRRVGKTSFAKKLLSLAAYLPSTIWRKSSSVN